MSDYSKTHLQQLAMTTKLPDETAAISWDNMLLSIGKISLSNHFNLNTSAF